MSSWKDHIVEKYILNIRNAFLGDSFDEQYLGDFNFTEDQNKHIRSKVKLETILKQDCPLIYLLNTNQLKLFSFIINDSPLKFNINERCDNQSVFTALIDHYIQLYPDNLEKNFWSFQDNLSSLFSKGYLTSDSDKNYLKTKNLATKKEQRAYYMFASYSLKLNDFDLILKMMTNIELIMSLSSIKNNVNIGFQNTIEQQVINSTKNNSSYQNEVINLIDKKKKNEFFPLKEILKSSRRNISEQILDKKLKLVIYKINIK